MKQGLTLVEGRQRPAPRHGGQPRQHKRNLPNDRSAPAPNPEAADLGLYNLSAERSVLGAICVYPGAYQTIRERVELTGEDFSDDAIRAVWEAAVGLCEQDVPPDPILVVEELKRTRVIESARDYRDLSWALSEAMRQAPLEYQIVLHALVVREYSLKRQLHALQFDPSEDVFSEIERIQQKLQRLSELKKSRLLQIGFLVADAFDAIQLSAEQYQTGETIPGFPSGLAVIDRMTGGFRGGDLIILAGRPSMGKTGLALSMATNAVLAYDRRVLLFSLEMTAPALSLRAIAGEAKVPATRMRTGELYIGEIDLIGRAALRFVEHNAKLLIDDSASLTVADLVARVKRVQAKYPGEPLLVVVDYLQKMDARGNSREEIVGAIARGLKTAAKTLGVPLVALAQCNREVDQKHRRPVLSDLRESGWIEQEADLVMFVHRPEYYGITIDEENQSTAGIAEIIIAKNRDGETGVRRVAFQAEFARFENLAITAPAPDQYEPGRYVDNDFLRETKE